MDFLSLIKRINTDNLIRSFAELTINMFNESKPLMALQLPILQYGRCKTCDVTLSGWDVLNIEYLSVVHSNDYRSAKRIPSAAEIVRYYRVYENEAQREQPQFKGGHDEILRTILGMTSEQFKYQNLAWVFERFNRNYYILIEGKGFEHRQTIDVDAITQEVLGLCTKDYIALLVVLLWLCKQHPDPLTAPQKLYRMKEPTVLTQENLSRLVEYYSCTYEELRESSIGKQLLYAKPFIHTKRSGYLMSSFYTLIMTLANGVYWLVREYYKGQGTQKFTNAFGLLFEDYIKDLAHRYCKENEWKTLSKTEMKGADFLFFFDEVPMLVEAKSALIQLDTMQQVPNDESIKKFYKNTILEAYEQLESSYRQLFHGKVEVIKTILLYDEFSNTAIMEKSLQEVFLNDQKCYIITIREFEILLFLHKNDKKSEKEVIGKMLNSKYSNNERENFGTILADRKIYENRHLKGELNYFRILLEHLKSQLE